MLGLPRKSRQVVWKVCAMSARHDQKVNAAFGRTDLMKPEHFRFVRQSGIPYGYFNHRQAFAEKWLKRLCVACILLCTVLYLLTR